MAEKSLSTLKSRKVPGAGHRLKTCQIRRKHRRLSGIVPEAHVHVGQLTGTPSTVSNGLRVLYMFKFC